MNSMKKLTIFLSNFFSFENKYLELQKYFLLQSITFVYKYYIYFGYQSQYFILKNIKL